MDDRDSPLACSNPVLRVIALPKHWTGLDWTGLDWTIATVGHEEGCLRLASSAPNFLSCCGTYTIACHKCLRREAPLEQLPAYSLSGDPQVRKQQRTLGSFRSHVPPSTQEGMPTNGESRLQ